jgi:hypothetical protein
MVPGSRIHASLEIVLCLRYFGNNITKYKGVLPICHSRAGGNPGVFELDPRLSECVAIKKSA